MTRPTGRSCKILPTARIYAVTPVYNMRSTSDLGGQLILKPVRNLEWRSDIDALWLSSSRDLWYAGDAAFDNHLFGYTSSSELRAKLSTVVDSGVNWKVYQHPQFLFL